MGYRASAGLPGKTAAYQRETALYQRAVAGCSGVTLTSTLLRRVTPVPKHPNAPGAAFTRQGRDPQAPQSPGGFALAPASCVAGRCRTSGLAPRSANPDASGNVMRRAGRRPLKC